MGFPEPLVPSSDDEGGRIEELEDVGSVGVVIGEVLS